MNPTTPSPGAREEQLPFFAAQANPAGLDGIEFIEYQTSRPHALGQVLQMMGFRPVAQHRSREVLLYRQGALNIVVNAHGEGARPQGDGLAAQPRLHAIALRVRDAQAAFAHLLEQGAWAVSSHSKVMEMNIPAIRGVGGSRIYLVDRYREFSIYDVDFVRLPGVEPQPAAVADMRFFGVVQYIGPWRMDDWAEFYRVMFGAEKIPDTSRFGIMPAGSLLQLPALTPGQEFMIQLVEPSIDSLDTSEQLQRIGLGVADVCEAVRSLRALGMDFVETPSTHTEARGALTKTYLDSVAFELVRRSS